MQEGAEAAVIPTAAQGKQLPERYGFWNSTQRFIGEVFGQFITTTFWKELFKSIVHQAFTSFLMALGGTLVWYGREKANKEISNTIASAGGPGSPTASVVNKAFGGSSYPPSSYQPSTGYPVATRPGGDTRFPGFG